MWYGELGEMVFQGYSVKAKAVKGGWVLECSMVTS